MKRGEVYFIEKSCGEPAVGRETYAARPGIIVSNDKNNAASGTVQVIFLTRQPKKDLQTHVTIRSLPYNSIALCEQIHTVSVDRIGDFYGTITER